MIRKTRPNRPPLRPASNAASGRDGFAWTVMPVRLRSRLGRSGHELWQPREMRFLWPGVPRRWYRRSVTNFVNVKVKIDCADQIAFDRLLRDWQREHFPDPIIHKLVYGDLPGSNLIVISVPLEFVEHVKATGLIGIEIVQEP